MSQDQALVLGKLLERHWPSESANLSKGLLKRLCADAAAGTPTQFDDQKVGYDTEFPSVDEVVKILTALKLLHDLVKSLRESLKRPPTKDETIEVLRQGIDKPEILDDIIGHA